MARFQSWTTAKDLIQSGAHLQEISDILSKLSKEDVETIYEKNWNLLHFAISTNSAETVEYMFRKDLFLAPHENNTIPYMHMACAYGYESVVEIVLKYRPNDRNTSIEVDNDHWKYFMVTKLPEGVQDSDHARISSELNKKSSLTAFEVAVLYQHEGCLLRLLSDFSKDEWLGKLAEFDQFAVVDKLLEITEVNAKALDYGFERALYHTSPRCLDILLQYATRQSITFKQRNPYHFMYHYSLDSSTIPGNCVECTRVLIKYGWDVCDIHSPSTFPLYSLLYAVMDVSYTCFETLELEEELDCLKDLLVAGANPNHNEIHHETLHLWDMNLSAFEQKLMRTAAVRPSFYSAPDALMYLLENSNFDHYLSVWGFISEAVVLLVDHGCDMAQVDDNSRSFAHHAFNYIGAILCFGDLDDNVIPLMTRTIGTVLQHGGDLHSRDFINSLPLTYFSKAFVTGIGIHLIWQDVEENDMCETLCARVKPLCYFLNMMDLEKVHEVVQESSEVIETSASDLIPLNVKAGLISVFHSYSGSVRSLYLSCLIKVWYSCGCRWSQLKNLALPMSILDDIKDRLTPV